jgi:hypothetical protein
MIPRQLQEIVTAIKRAPRTNPPIDPGAQLQVELANRHLLHRFTEEEITEAAIEVGVPSDEVNGFLESMASWL